MARDGLPLFLTELPAGADQIVLSGPEGRHAATVTRLRVGERLLLADGRGEVAKAEVISVTKDELRAVLRERVREAEPALRVTMAQALLKGDRAELAVDQAVEVGVDALVPWRAARCVARWDSGPRGAKALERWRSTARSAAKQARRSWLPPVHEPTTTAGLAERVRSAALALVLHESADARLTSVDLPASGELLLVVGPEGGIDDAELAALTEAGARPVLLGDTVLRASTAGVAALAALWARSGRW
ncbi:Ribosomal RNA small subunit methyltransferase E [Actinoalloteichus hoggarensis]|uniref:Ribosomal RNA small subunit methyltransferase E n=2 Tax=Actinoalloteichus hoggarensis TaxID=1470176 RepID=A0A221W8N2_9PSEU|nr:Ribosomal RNA small subunit methyltransferase E [Actinoalloteichus hoggarensis]